MSCDGFNPLKDVKEFHEKFGIAYSGPPRELDKKLEEFRYAFMVEEITEYLSASPYLPFIEDAAYKERLADQFDALIDLVYVALGTSLLHGFDFAEGWRRVHKANMAKVRARDASESKRHHEADVVKPHGWQAPSLIDLV